MKKLLSTTALALGLASQALAGNPAPAPAPTMPVAPPVAAAASDWSGFYAGGLVSFDSGTVSAFTNDIPGISRTLESNTAFGGFVGYNRQVNNLVFGGELAYTTGNIPVTGLLSSFVTDRVDAKGRLGYSFGSAFVYGVVGYS